MCQILWMMYQGFQSAFRGGDRPPNTSLWVPKWNYVPSMFEWGPESDTIGCTKFNKGGIKFNEWCTKFCEWCTKGPKMRSEVGISSKSLCYGFLNEIMAHPCSDGGPKITRLGCTKFNEWWTKFCEGCTKGPKMSYEVGINPQSLCYGFIKEIMDYPYWNCALGIYQIECTKFGTSFIKFGTSDSTDFETPISAWIVHNFI